MERPYLIRRAKKRDLPLLTNSWLKSFRDADWVRGCPNSIYYGFQHSVIDHLIPRSVVLCAVNETDTDQILGWCAAEVVQSGDTQTVLIIHYCYTKETFRKLGVAKTLVETLIATEEPVAIMYTHKTRALQRLGLHEKGFIYNPFVLYANLPEGWANAPA